MLYQFNADGTVSLLEHLEKLAANGCTQSKSQSHRLSERSEMDAWVAQDFWRIRNRINR